MTARRTTSPEVDDYIAGFPPAVQKKLEQLRAALHKGAPGAEEAIKYAIPTLVLNGNLIHFAAFAKHIGLYPAPREHEDFQEELSAYGGGKGTVQFPLDRPLPLDLIRRIVRFRVQENAKRAAAKQQRKVRKA